MFHTSAVLTGLTLAVLPLMLLAFQVLDSRRRLQSSLLSRQSMSESTVAHHTAHEHWRSKNVCPSHVDLCKVQSALHFQQPDSQRGGICCCRGVLRQHQNGGTLMSHVPGCSSNDICSVSFWGSFTC
jgi:hypothetical protein